jgi:hypothetical protein
MPSITGVGGGVPYLPGDEPSIDALPPDPTIDCLPPDPIIDGLPPEPIIDALPPDLTGGGPVQLPPGVDPLFDPGVIDCFPPHGGGFPFPPGEGGGLPPLFGQGDGCDGPGIHHPPQIGGSHPFGGIPPEYKDPGFTAEQEIGIKLSRDS